MVVPRYISLALLVSIEKYNEELPSQ